MGAARNIASQPLPHIAYAPPRPDATPEAELAALVAIYKFVLFDSQASKGGPDVLTKNSTQENTASQDMKGTGNANLHGD
jgi:hypothetical protein